MTCHKTKHIFVILISKIPNKTKIIGLICPAVFFTEIFVFRSSNFPFLGFVHFRQSSYKNKKYYVILVYILQSKMGKMEKNHTIKVTKIPKSKRRKYGTTKQQFTKTYIGLQNLQLDKFNLLSQFLSGIYTCIHIFIKSMYRVSHSVV